VAVCAVVAQRLVPEHRDCLDGTGDSGHTSEVWDSVLS
jgi:hypothetical protein